MLGAFKFWGTKQNSPKHSPRNAKRTISTLNLTSSVDDVETNEMANYGHLLTCALCRELFTHPVLLPCQHSMCYGCARAQIMDPIMTSAIEESCNESMLDETSSVTSLMDVTSRQNSFTESLDVSYNRPQSVASPKIPRSSSRVTSPVDRHNGNGAFEDPPSPNASIVLSTKDFLHFKQVTPQPKQRQNGPEAASPALNQTCCAESITPKGRSIKKVNSASCGRKGFLKSAKNVSSSSNLLRSSAGRNSHSNLRRSSSTSSLVRASLRQQQSFESLKKSKVKSLYCPSCDRNVELGNLGISGLFRNFALESIVERFRSKAKAAVAIRCGYCKPPAADATKSCLDCKLSYCNECFKSVHIWGTKKAQHDYVGPTNNFSRPKVLLCPEHNQEAVTMYCNRCKKSVCRMCKSGGGNHANHPISSSKLAFKEGKEKLCADLEILKKKKEEVNEKIESLGEAFKELERKESAAREEIHSSIDEMHRLLEVKRNDLLGKAETRMRDEEKRMRAGLQELYTKQMYTGVTSFAEEILKETDPNYFLQNMKMVEFRIREAIEQLSQPEYEEKSKTTSSASLDLHLNTSGLKDKLDAMHFIDAPGIPEIRPVDVTARASSTITWSAASTDDVIDHYEVKFAPKDVPHEIQTTTKPILDIPEQFRAVDCDVTIRAVNNAGTSEWTQPFLLKSMIDRKFKLTCQQSDGEVIIDPSGLNAQVRSKKFCVFKGDVGLWNGEHTWRVAVTSRGAGHVIVGVSGAPRQGDKNGLHGRESYSVKDDADAVARVGAFLHFTTCVARCSASLPQNYDDELTGIGGLKSGGIADGEPFECTQRWEIGISLRIRTGNEATVSFFDVTNGENEKKCTLERSFWCSLPVWPTILAKGNATISLV